MSFDLRSYGYRDIQEETQCLICLETLDEKKEMVGHPAPTSTNLTVDHVFHTECLQPWWNSHGNCPSCQQKLADPGNRFGGKKVRRVSLKVLQAVIGAVGAVAGLRFVRAAGGGDFARAVAVGVACGFAQAVADGVESALQYFLTDR